MLPDRGTHSGGDGMVLQQPPMGRDRIKQATRSFVRRRLIPRAADRQRLGGRRRSEQSARRSVHLQLTLASVRILDLTLFGLCRRPRFPCVVRVRPLPHARGGEPPVVADGGPRPGAEAPLQRGRRRRRAREGRQARPVAATDQSWYPCHVL